MEVVVQALPISETMGRQVMQTPEDVALMLRLKAAGLGIKKIAERMGCSKNTVRRYVRSGGYVAYKRPERNSALHGLSPWLSERLQRHRGNADVVRQDLEREHGLRVSLRTVERAVAPFRRELLAAEVATIRFETAPGEQLQIDFGETTMPIAGERVRVHLFVATLGYSRRPYVAVFSHERQSAWWSGIEGAFHHFGGRTRELLIDNARACHLDPTLVLARDFRFAEQLHGIEQRQLAAGGGVEQAIELVADCGQLQSRQHLRQHVRIGSRRFHQAPPVTASYSCKGRSNSGSAAGEGSCPFCGRGSGSLPTTPIRCSR